MKTYSVAVRMRCTHYYTVEAATAKEAERLIADPQHRCGLAVDHVEYTHTGKPHAVLEAGKDE